MSKKLTKKSLPTIRLMANVESTIMYNPGTTKKFINKTKSRFSPQELIKIDDK